MSWIAPDADVKVHKQEEEYRGDRKPSGDTIIVVIPDLLARDGQVTFVGFLAHLRG